LTRINTPAGILNALLTIDVDLVVEFYEEVPGLTMAKSVYGTSVVIICG
jgi:hypothetical protein